MGITYRKGGTIHALVVVAWTSRRGGQGKCPVRRRGNGRSDVLIIVQEGQASTSWSDETFQPATVNCERNDRPIASSLERRVRIEWNSRGRGV